jgi:hypothetical protein
MKNHFFHKDIRFLVIFSAAIITILFVFLSIEKKHSRRDERNFNLPTAVNFYEKPLNEAISGSGYLTGTPPLPFVILKILTLGSYPNIFVYRLITFLLSLVSFLLLINVLSNLTNIKEAFYISGLIFFQPYFLKSSITFYTAAYGVFFLFLFLIYYMKSEKAKTRSIILGLTSSAAILCQQAYIAIPAAYTLIVLNDVLTRKSTIRKSEIVLFYLPHLIPAFFFIIWGGLTRDQPRNEIIMSSASALDFIRNLIPFKNITAILTISGFYVMPASLYFLKKIKWPYLVIFITISILLAVFNQPVFTKFSEFNKVTGIVHRLIFSVSVLNPVLGEIARVLSITSFFIFIYLLIKESRFVRSDFLLLMIFALLGIFSFDFLLSERHLIPLIILLFVCLYRLKIREIYYYIWFFIMMLVGCEYTIYWFNY